jgi:hypothetical protein
VLLVRIVNGAREETSNEFHRLGEVLDGNPISTLIVDVLFNQVDMARNVMHLP